LKKFPHTVQLHRKYAGDGLVVMSLDIMPDEWQEKEKVLKFLTEKEATFPNYIFLDRRQKIDDWTDRHEAYSTPALVVFDRNGKRVPPPAGHTPEEEEAFVRKLLGK
jgi:hypothetical protein